MAFFYCCGELKPIQSLWREIQLLGEIKSMREHFHPSLIVFPINHSSSEETIRRSPWESVLRRQWGENVNVTAWAGKLPSVGHYSGTGDYSSTRPDSDCNINESEPNVNASREHHKKLAYILEWFKLWSVTVMFSQRWFQIVCVFFF